MTESDSTELRDAAERLTTVREQVSDGENAETVAEARNRVRSYRETVEGV